MFSLKIKIKKQVLFLKKKKLFLSFEPSICIMVSSFGCECTLVNEKWRKLAGLFFWAWSLCNRSFDKKKFSWEGEKNL